MPKPDALVRGVILILTVAAAAVLVRESGLGYGLDDLRRWTDAEIAGGGFRAGLVFVAAGAVLTGIGVSRQAFAFVAGYAFGVVAGSALALTAEMAGVVLAFAYARWLGRDLVARRFPRSVRRLDAFLERNPFAMTLAVRLSPISNNLAVNLLAGVSRVPAAPFLAASALGHAPQTIVFALVGSGLAGGIVLKSGLAVALFAVSALLGLHLYRRYRAEPAGDAVAPSMGDPDTAAAGADAGPT